MLAVLRVFLERRKRQRKVVLSGLSNNSIVVNVKMKRRQRYRRGVKKRIQLAWSVLLFPTIQIHV